MYDFTIIVPVYNEEENLQTGRNGTTGISKNSNQKNRRPFC